MKIARFSVHLAHIRFTEADRGKLRPVILLTKPTGTFNTVLVAPIYSVKIHDLLTTDHEVEGENVAAYGLAKKSTVRLHRITELPLVSLIETLGQPPPGDKISLRQKLRILFDLNLSPPKP